MRVLRELEPSMHLAQAPFKSIEALDTESRFRGGLLHCDLTRMYKVRMQQLGLLGEAST